jgi:DNA polymerase-3 subunit chi
LTDSRIRVDFYILPAKDTRARLQFTCRLTEKVYGLQHRVHAHAASSGQARELDELLWTFRQGSFLPHALSTSSNDAPVPITIGYDEETTSDGDLLINLADNIPTFFDRFARIAEIVDGTEESRRLGRERFGFYRDNGYEPNTHNIS